MLKEIIIYLHLFCICFVADQAFGLLCYECNLKPRQNSSSSSGIPKCAIDMDFLGDLTQCNEQTTACSEAKVVLQGKSLSFRSCQNNPNIHLGMCHKVKIAGATTNICFCHSDGCNGSRRSVIPCIFWKMIFTIVCLLEMFSMLCIIQ